MLYLCVGLIPEESKINANGQQLFSNDWKDKRCMLDTESFLLLSRLPRPSCRSHLFFNWPFNEKFCFIRRSGLQKNRNTMDLWFHSWNHRRSKSLASFGSAGDVGWSAKPVFFVGFFSVFSHHHAKVCSPINLVSHFTMFQVHSSFKFVFFMLF